jgi:hypothetical protein
MPPLITMGRDGVPLVNTWQPAAGELLLVHTLVVLNPPTGKLNDWAEAGCTARVIPISTVTATKTKYNLLRIVVFSIGPI